MIKVKNHFIKKRSLLKLLILVFSLLLSCINVNSADISNTQSTVIVTEDYFITYNRRVDLTVPSSREIKGGDSSYRTFDLIGNSNSFSINGTIVMKSNFNTTLSLVQEVDTIPNLENVTDRNSALNIFSTNNIYSFFIEFSESNKDEFIVVFCRYTLYHVIEVKEITERGILINWKTQLNGRSVFE